MSAVTGRLLPILPPSFCVSSSFSSRRPASTTVNPAFISASDAARPTPVPAPVTIAIFSAASAMCFFPVWLVKNSNAVIPGRAPSRGPGIHNPGVVVMDSVLSLRSPRNDGVSLCFLLVGRPRNVLVRGAKRRRPARAQIVEVGLAGLDAVIEIGVASVGAHHQHVDRQADAEVGAHGRIHRDQPG